MLAPLAKRCIQHCVWVIWYCQNNLAMSKAAALLQAVYGDVALLPQAVTADFMLEGHFGRHLREIRQLYQQKQQYCLQLIAEFLPEAKLHARYAGLHVTSVSLYSGRSATDGRAFKARLQSSR